MSKFFLKFNASNLIWVLFAFLYFNSLTVAAQEKPVVAGHPRIFLDGNTKSMLLAKKANANAGFTELMVKANELADFPVKPWTPDDANVWADNKLIYSYCGSNYEEYAMTLGMAHQLTKGNTSGAANDKYSAKMNQLTDEIISAYYKWPPQKYNSEIYFNLIPITPLGIWARQLPFYMIGLMMNLDPLGNQK